MQFTTPVPIVDGNPKIEYESRIVSLGSCFAVNIGQKLDYFKFRNTTNPFGILFHPLAIEKFLEYTAGKKEFTNDDIFYHNERWHCYDAHSDLSANEPETIVQSLNHAVNSTFNEVCNATHVIITLGTAWAYRSIETGSLVANCHKVPQRAFTKEILRPETIKEALFRIKALIDQINKNAVVIFTISPVRHIKDGFVENQRSKANLITALHEVLQSGTSKGMQYFSAYEIMMDELRDYRFYAEDLVHPNATAIKYIWERFVQTWINNEAFAVMKEVDAIQKSLLHRPYNPDGEQHKVFKEQLQKRINALQKHHPHIEF